MKFPKPKVGDAIVYPRYAGTHNQGPLIRIDTFYVHKVGHKYFYASADKKQDDPHQITRWENQFRLDTWKHTAYSVDQRAFPSMDMFEIDAERKQLISKCRDILDSPWMLDKMNITQARAMAGLLTEIKRNKDDD